MVDRPPDDDPDDSAGPAEIPEESTEDHGGIGRRGLLKYGALAAVGLGAATGGYLALSGDGDPPGEWTSGDDTIARETVERFAPVFQFGASERWYPTDPREYASDRDGATVVDGFAALDGYTAAFRETGSPPDPVVFYRTLAEETSSLGVIQYWAYAAFDQFAVNFHWHDWELVQVFFDRETDEVVLIAASSHSRRVPNNEHLGGPERRVGILAEVGSHSSATDIDRNGRFVRAEAGDLAADVTNALVRIAEDLNPLPLAYGLPRGEGGILPYAVPELDGAPLYEHPDLPNVREQDLIDEPLAVRDLASLSSPPTDVPPREPGLRFVPDAGDPSGDEAVGYALEPIAPVAESIDDFTGPQLSFEFAIPGIVEDQFASHITSVGRPWEQPRYDQPLGDVSDRGHRGRIADRFGLDAGDDDGETVLAQVQRATEDLEGELRGAPDDARTELEAEIGYTLTDPSVEALALLESESVAVPSVGGAIRLTGVESGDHRLVVEGAGYAPHAERLRVGADGDDDGTTDGNGSGGETSAIPGDRRPANRPGADGYLTAVPREKAVKLRAQAPETPGGIDRVRIAEDYAGAAFDGRPATADDGGDDDGFAVYVHRAGSYVVDVTDEDGVPGTDRVRPGRREDDDGEETVELSGETGTASLAEFLAEYLRESADLTREYRQESDDGTTTATTTGGGGNGGTPTTTDDDETTAGGGATGGAGVAELFDRAADAAERAAEVARDGDVDRADTHLETIRNRLDALRTRIEAQRGGPLSETLATVLRDRVEGSDRRAVAAIEADR